MGDATEGTINESAAAAVLARCAVEESGVRERGESGEGRGSPCGSSGLALDELMLLPTPAPTTANRLAWSSSAILWVRRATTGER